jgi:FKBP-type peptidyl-prolyl cis-trans isomerase FkpA
MSCFLSACNSNSGEVNGIKYTFHTQDKSAKGVSTNPEDTAIVKMHFKMYTDKDSMFQNTYESGQPLYIPAKGDFFLSGLLQMLHQGDSLTFYALSDSVFGEQLPPFMSKGAQVKTTLKILDILNSQEEKDAERKIMEDERNKEMQKMIEEQMAAQQKYQEELEKSAAPARELLDNWIKEKGIKTQKTESGIHYVIEKKGTGVINKGDEVEVHYRGTLLDGSQFDASYDRNETFKVPIGMGRVIPGWDEGIPLFGNGGKGKIYIPSHLAYGPREAGPIPPNSPLIFEVEVVSVTPAQQQAQ